MPWEIPKVEYTGKIREVTLGTGDKAVTVGGETAYPFHVFEGDFPHSVVISYEVPDREPVEWPDPVKEPFKDVLKSPADWAKKCVEEWGAKLITLQLTAIDPHGENLSVDEEMKIVEEVLKAVDIPIIFWGCDDVEKDAQVLRKIAEIAEGRNIALGPVVDKNYKLIGATAIAYKQVVIASTPIDVNLAKQLNILLLDLGVPEDKILMDPTTGGLGYGIEYTYSVMERDRIAALVQQDDKLAFPMICNLAREIWKTKEAGLKEEEFPELGKQEDRGIMMEAITAVLLALAGANILIMRHPRAIKLVGELMEEMIK